MGKKEGAKVQKSNSKNYYTLFSQMCHVYMYIQHPDQHLRRNVLQKLSAAISCYLIFF